MARSIRVPILGDASDYKRALGEAQTKTSKFGAVAKTALIGGAAAGFYALGKAAKMGWDEFNQGQQVAAQTAAAIKSTGGIAGITAKHVDELAQSMLKLTGIDDEATASAENQLLTFTKIGAKGGIFDRATQATADLATRLNGGAIPSFEKMNSTAIMVGKGLNNPISGLTRLQRVGVEFTDKQKDQIAALVEAGKTMKAQKIILGALEQQYGGSAKAAGETFVGSIQKAKERLNDFLGVLVGKAIPYLQRFIQWLGPVLSRWGEKAQKVIETLRERWQDFGKVLQRHQGTISKVVTVIGFLIKVVAKLIGWQIKLYLTYLKVWLKILDVTLMVTDKVIGAVSRMWEWIRDKFNAIRGAAQTVMNKFGDLASRASSKFGIVKDAINGLLGPIRTVIGWVQTLIGWIEKIPSIPFGGGGDPGPGSRGGRFPGAATGGDITRTGLALVHRGEHVTPARIANRGGGGGGVMQVNLTLDRRVLASVLVDTATGYARQNGGRALLG